jgi:two-component sensor histidine kinase
VLLKEIHHRVKNNLQVISSILNMQGTMITDPLAHSYFKDCETRVQSMALVHEQLYQTTTLTSIEMPSYINELITTLLSAINIDLNGLTVEQQIEPVSMDLDHAIPLGLIINELLSNAFKYAYPDGSGTVSIILNRVESGCRLAVRDYGVGIAGTIATGESLGVQLVEALTTQLDGSVTFRNAEPGLEAVVEISACSTEIQP